MSVAMNYTDEMLNIFYDGRTEPKIVVIGCGGAGGNIVQSIYRMNLWGIETVAINTDKKNLDEIEVDKKVYIKKNVREYMIEAVRGSLEEVTSGDIVFLVAGMGGDAGTRATPLIARIARNQGAVTFGIIITPFEVEDRKKIVQEGVRELRGVTDSTIVLDNNSLSRLTPTLTLQESFSVIDKTVIKIIKSVSAQASISYLSTLPLDILEIASEIKRKVSSGEITVNSWVDSVGSFVEAKDQGEEFCEPRDLGDSW